MSCDCSVTCLFIIPKKRKRKRKQNPYKVRKIKEKENKNCLCPKHPIMYCPKEYWLISLRRESLN